MKGRKTKDKSRVSKSIAFIANAEEAKDGLYIQRNQPPREENDGEENMASKNLFFFYSKGANAE